MRRADRSTRPRALTLMSIGVAAFLVACAGEAPSAAAGDGPFTDADRTAIREAWDALLAAQEQVDWATLETYLTDDFMHLDPRVSGPIAGLEDWRIWVESMDFGLTEGDLVHEALEVDGSGDVGYIVWTLSGSWTEGGEPVAISGKGVSLYRRQDDGSWLLARNVWNPDPS